MTNTPVEMMKQTFVGDAAKAVSILTKRRIEEYFASQRDGSNAKTKLSMNTTSSFIMSSIRQVVLLGALPSDYWAEDLNRINLLRLYNPKTFMWEPADTFLSNILTGVLGTYQDADLSKLAVYIFNNGVLNADIPVVPEPYTGMRFQLFRNGILDLKDLKMVEVEETVKTFSQTTDNGEVYDTLEIPQGQEATVLGEYTLPTIGFTPKHLHNIDFKIDAPDPHYKNSADDSEDWTPDGWVKRLCDGSPEQIAYIYQVIGTMIVPNHRFNAFIEINGSPNSGKTTLVNLANHIYNRRESTLMGASVSSLKDSFPFRGGVTENTDLVHITEVNGAYLNETDVDFLNSFANDAMQMKQLGSESVTLTPPPVLVLEGKGWARFNSVQTGVARRLLPLDITQANTKGYHSKRYGRKIFEQPKVLQRILWQAMSALHALTEGNDYFMYQLDDPDTMPKFVQEWHFDAVNAGDEIMKTFAMRIEDVLKPGYIQMNLLYDMYITTLKEDYQNIEDRRKVTRGIRSFRETAPVFLRNKFQLVPLEGLHKFNEDQLGIDMNALGEVLDVDELFSAGGAFGSVGYENSTYCRFKKPDWYKLVPAEEKEN